MHSARTACIFCGADTAKLSNDDKSNDTGRVQLYCDNQRCEAREVEVIVMRDGKQGALRADVRALEAVDARTMPGGSTARRTGRESYTLEVPGSDA